MGIIYYNYLKGFFKKYLHVRTMMRNTRLTTVMAVLYDVNIFCYEQMNLRFIIYRVGGLYT